MTSEFDGSAAFVSGAAGGIGRAVVDQLTNRGAAVAGFDLVEPGDTRNFFSGDLSLEDEVEALVGRAVEQFGAPKYVVTCSGVVAENDFADLPTSSWARTLDASLTSSFLFLRALVPHMVNWGGGAIVTLSSGWGRKGYPRGSDYSAAKAGVEGLTKSIALEFAGRGIRANSVAPGPIRTAMIEDNPLFDEAAKSSVIPMGRIGEVADVVDPVMFLLSDSARYVTGQVLHVNGGLLMP